MAQNITNTYHFAKEVFNTLGLKEDVLLDIPIDTMKVFRKHLSEMIKRQQSSNKYATRVFGNKIKVVRIQ